MDLGLGDKAEHGHKGPGQYAGLAPRQFGYSLAPPRETPLYIIRAIQECVETYRERLCSSGRLDGVTKGHFFKGEKEVRAGFNGHALGGDFRKLALRQELFERKTVEAFFPALMGLSFVIAFPIDIGGIMKCLLEVPAKLGAAPADGRT